MQSKVIILCGHPRHLGNLGIGTRLVHRFDAFPRKRRFPGGRKHSEGRGDVGKEVRRELAAALTLTVTMSIVTHSTRA
ncbi:hypothetical protein ABZ027_25695 [Streptomyces sp. NPDC006332]|uniref:hypothetical protein n=1 Tax=Streptomyces sp. NPDC006332 TaxID=3155456 RepID=UPI0033AE34CF